MKTIATVTGIGGAVGAMAAAGRPVLAGAGALLLVLTAALCWVVTDTGRTARLVRVIRAVRGK
jgi:hypothetical protein